MPSTAKKSQEKKTQPKSGKKDLKSLPTGQKEKTEAVKKQAIAKEEKPFSKKEIIELFNTLPLEEKVVAFRRILEDVVREGELKEYGFILSVSVGGKGLAGMGGHPGIVSAMFLRELATIQKRLQGMGQ